MLAANQNEEQQNKNYYDEVRRAEALLKAGALQNAIFNSANFSSIATDAKGVIQIFNVGAERMLGCVAADVMNKITPADISDSITHLQFCFEQGGCTRCRLCFCI